jgi:hypothetical protein
MNDIKDLRNALLRTGDGRSVFLWVLVFSALLVRSIVSSGPSLHQSSTYFFNYCISHIFQIQSERLSARAENKPMGLD